jgi:hypothetical protein
VIYFEKPVYRDQKGEVVKVWEPSFTTLTGKHLWIFQNEFIRKVRLQLRPLSTLTSEEKLQMEKDCDGLPDWFDWNEERMSGEDAYKEYLPYAEWCRKHHFDVDDLIENGLADPFTPPTDDKG